MGKKKETGSISLEQEKEKIMFFNFLSVATNLILDLPNPRFNLLKEWDVIVKKQNTPIPYSLLKEDLGCYCKIVKTPLSIPKKRESSLKWDKKLGQKIKIFFRKKTKRELILYVLCSLGDEIASDKYQVYHATLEKKEA